MEPGLQLRLWAAQPDGNAAGCARGCASRVDRGADARACQVRVAENDAPLKSGFGSGARPGTASICSRGLRFAANDVYEFSGFLCSGIERMGMRFRKLRIVMPGGSGQLGRMLAAHFQERGHHVTVLTRGPYTAPWQTVHWDGVNRGPWIQTLEGADVCIHLSGRSVNCRATAKNRKALYGSRIGTTQLVGDAISVLDNPPRVWLNASTATIYRHALDRDMDEAAGEIGGGEWISKHRRAPANWNWTIRLVKDWEAALFE